MKKEVWIGKKNFRFFYYKYKDSSYYPISIVTLTILICLILIFQVVIPQFTNWFSIRKEVIATQEKIRIINGNINIMRSIDKAALDAHLQVASSSLPTNKDFGAVLKALSEAAIRSGVSLQDFTFHVGSIETSKELSTIKLSLVVNGKIEGIRRFIKELGEKLPISEVINIDGSVQSLSVTVQFYQKKFPDIVLNDEQPIQPVSSEKKVLLQKLSSWQPADMPETTAVGSASATEIPLF